MSWIQKTVASVRASGGRFLKSPAKQPVTETVATQVNDEGRGQWWKWLARQSVTENVASEIYDEGRRIGQKDWGRIVLISGKCYCPPVTVNPRFEVWNYNKLPTVPKLSAKPNAATFFPKTNDLVLVALGALGVVGTNYFLRWQNRKQFQSKVANAAAASVREAVDQAVQGAAAQAFQSAIYQEAIGQALQNAAQNDIGHAWNDPSLTYILNAAPAQDTVDVRDALVLALQDAVVKAALCKAARDTIASIRTSDLSTEEVLQAYVDAGGVPEMKLRSFLDTFGLVAGLPTGELTVKQCVLSSVEEMVECGITEDYAAKLKKAVFCLLSHPLL